jgi:hypothetical protein
VISALNGLIDGLEGCRAILAREVAAGRLVKGAALGVAAILRLRSRPR